MDVYYINEIKTIFDYILLNKGMLDELEYNDEYELYTDGDVEYQLRTYSNGAFESILVRYPNIPVHCYREFKEYEYETPEDLIYDVLSEETLDSLDRAIEKELRRIRDGKKRI